MTGWGRTLAISALALAMAGMGTSAQAQGNDPFASAKQLTDGGKYREAIASLSKTLNSGTLDPANTARGFFLRGVSFTKAKKNPQAISDLTNALWLTGLNETDRAEAYRMRAVAYKASGFKAKAAADLKRAKTAGAASQTTVAIAAPKNEAAATTSPANDAWAAQTANAPKSKVVAAKPVATQPSGNAVTSFFDNLFSSGSTPTPAQKTATAAKPTVAKQPTAAKQNETAISSWSSSVDSAPEITKPVASAKKQVAAVNWNTATASAPKAVVKKKVPVKKKIAKKGSYNVQVATVRDRAAAEKIRVEIARQAPKDLAGLKPSIDTAVLGNMGTFFRVRVDGLPTRQASASLCATLSKQGHDCFLLTR